MTLFESCNNKSCLKLPKNEEKYGRRWTDKVEIAFWAIIIIAAISLLWQTL